MFFPQQIFMMASKPARLKVILGENNVEKLTLRDGIPQSLVELTDIVQKTFNLVDIRLQYMDDDFGHEFFNLNSTNDLKDMGTIKVVQINVMPLTIVVTDEAPATVQQELDESSSVASNDTVPLSSPESVTSRTEQWPRKFSIRQFSFETEVQLERGNEEYRMNKKMLTLRTKAKSDILNGVIEDIYKYTAYPTDTHFCEVAEALIQKHPCLKEPGSYNGAYGWKQRFKYKMGNYRTELKGLGCPELCLNSKKETPNKAAAKGVKRPRRAEANYYPSLPAGESNETMEKERLEILTEMTKRNNERVVRNKMARTFAYRRQEIVNTEPRICNLQDRWPALFEQQEINEEFQRLVARPLETKFFAQLDKYGPALMALARSKGGEMREKILPIIHNFDQILCSESIDGPSLCYWATPICAPTECVVLV
ncbi:hypothetical protein WMY93_011924 [Mugilogobius chulae]|uniref:PB1 domain-containing protein n=1 Tax=Mugilogobius chulae TaxID=88201 RepID=A0AAW0PG52_9GOBI